MLTRRQTIASGIAAGTAVLVPVTTLRSRSHVKTAVVSGATLDPSALPKYVTSLFILPAMPRAGTVGGTIDYYTIGARQFRQQIPPAGRPSTTVFGYGSTTDSRTFHFPSYTIEAKVNRPVRVQWANQLVDGRGHFRPHLLAVDPTCHWANPGGGLTGRDSRPQFSSTPSAYQGPVPFVTHVHGSHVF